MMFGVFLGGSAYARSAPSLVLRFDDNKSVSQWREVAGIFEAVGGRCSFAVNSATLSEEQWDGLRELSAHGHEIMDHTGQHAVFKLLLESSEAAERYRKAEFFDHVESEGLLVLCRPEIDLMHFGNVRVTACMTNGVCWSDDPAFVNAQRFSRKFYVSATKRIYGFGKDCGGNLFKRGPSQKCSDFWGRWTTDSFAVGEIVILDDEAVQPSKDLLRAQARTTLTRFRTHGLPAPRTWIRPGGWETPIDWRRMKSVYGDEFGYVVADSTCGRGLAPYSPWCYRSDFAFFDMDKNVDEVYKRAVEVLNKGHSFSYVSHQWTADRTKYLEQCRALARKLKENGVPMTTYAHIAEASARSCQNR